MVNIVRRYLGFIDLGVNSYDVFENVFDIQLLNVGVKLLIYFGNKI